MRQNSTFFAGAGIEQERLDAGDLQLWHRSSSSAHGWRRTIQARNAQGRKQHAVRSDHLRDQRQDRHRHAEPAGEAQRAQREAAARTARGAARGRRVQPGALCRAARCGSAFLRRRRSQRVLVRPRRGLSRPAGDRRRRVAAGAGPAPAHHAVRHAQAGDRPGARHVHRHRHRPRLAVRHGDRRRRCADRLPAGARPRHAARQHVAVSLRPAMGEAPAVHRRQRHRRGRRAHRSGA